MPPASSRRLKANAADDQGPEVLLDLGDPGRPLSGPAPTTNGPERSAPATEPDQPLESAASSPAAPPAPPLKTANFVDPAWRGRKYITPEVFRRRVYAYFGYRPGKSTMNRWLQSGRIYAVRVGKLWLIPESTWEEFLAWCKEGMRF
ncbi:MAG TPA: hypothetical protein VFM21_12405 [Terriglobia bacterium]|nr:hypothetical protein [Terriglobia bacterium]